MSKKKDISAVFDEIIENGEGMVEAGKQLFTCLDIVVKAIKDMKAIVAPAPTAAIPEKATPAALPEKTDAPAAPAPAEKKYTFTEVRGIMAGLAGKGKKAEARALLQKYGVSRLSDLDEKDYGALVEEAKVIADG
jgi:hypothetical protein